MKLHFDQSLKACPLPDVAAEHLRDVRTESSKQNTVQIFSLFPFHLASRYKNSSARLRQNHPLYNFPPVSRHSVISFMTMALTFQTPLTVLQSCASKPPLYCPPCYSARSLLLRCRIPRSPNRSRLACAAMKTTSAASSDC